MHIVVVAILAAVLGACGRPSMPEAAPSSTRAISEGERALRAQAGAYYFDFYKQEPFKRFAPENLGLSGAESARFARAMGVAAPAVIVDDEGGGALAFYGCAAHNCGDTAAVLAIDLAGGDVFVGVGDEQGRAVLKENARLQRLLEAASPTREWSNPARGT